MESPPFVCDFIFLKSNILRAVLCWNILNINSLFRVTDKDDKLPQINVTKLGSCDTAVKQWKSLCYVKTASRLQRRWLTNHTPEPLIRVWQLLISIYISLLSWKPKAQCRIICSERLLPFRWSVYISAPGISNTNENETFYYCMELDFPNSSFWFSISHSFWC
jgi:hypothetical protein